jgi:hypothetical protein
MPFLGSWCFAREMDDRPERLTAKSAIFGRKAREQSSKFLHFPQLPVSFETVTARTASGH